jgi:hypothetical protein
MYESNILVSKHLPLLVAYLYLLSLVLDLTDLNIDKVAFRSLIFHGAVPLSMALSA